jgi:hypothetical protein
VRLRRGRTRMADETTAVPVCEVQSENLKSTVNWLAARLLLHPSDR